jgi:hypothetical protein
LKGIGWGEILLGGALIGLPIIPPSAFFTDPPFLSFSSTVGSVVIILTIGLN